MADKIGVLKRLDLDNIYLISKYLFTGHPPFLAESVPDLADKILNKDVPPLRVKGSRVSGKASPDFQNLLNCLLKKNPVDRSAYVS